ncbi:hypothetical protein [Corynebacterium poyangense]|uniref:hypothetical protein n=1 Tax=Corynebacterium poyangense TaxID=2684405 RepID=UPI002961E949|nr:hypothetical protein [Corynebacterium poyangense]
MSINSSAFALSEEPLSPSRRSHAGLWWGLLGVIAFSFTVPLTKVALRDDHLSALFVGSGAQSSPAS